MQAPGGVTGYWGGGLSGVRGYFKLNPSSVKYFSSQLDGCGVRLYYYF